MLSVFSRSASAFDPGAGAAPAGLAGLAFADAAATLRGLLPALRYKAAISTPSSETRLPVRQAPGLRN
jgi:hypothetical protein